MSSFKDEDNVDGANAFARLELTLFRWARSLSMELRVMAPARVIVYDPLLQKASLMLEQLPVKSLEGEPLPQLPILLPPVPVSMLRGMGGLAYQSIPILPGDTGLVLFSDRDLTTWLTNPATVPVDPISGAVHGLSSGVFFPGLHKDTDTPPPDPAAHVIEGPLVKLGATAVEFGLRGTALVATAATVQGALAAVPPAADPVTVIAACNANTAAVLALTAAITAALSTKVMIQ